MFYVMDIDKLVLFDDNLARLETTRGFMPQLTAKTLETDIVTEEELRQYPNKVIPVVKEEEIEITDYDLETGVIIGTHTETRIYYVLELNPDFEIEEAKKEKERIGNLECTKRVFILMLEELGISYFNTIKPLIESNQQAQLEWELCVQLQRKNPLLDVVGGQLGVTSEQLDDLFKFANGEITLEDFKGSTSVEASENDTEVEADGE